MGNTCIVTDSHFQDEQGFTANGRPDKIPGASFELQNHANHFTPTRDLLAMSIFLLINSISLFLLLATAVVVLTLLRITRRRLVWVLFSAAVVLLFVQHVLLLREKFVDTSFSPAVSLPVITLSCSCILLFAAILFLRQMIKQQKATEQELQRKEEKYRSITDNLNIGISLLSTDLKVLEVNCQMHQWFPHIDLTTDGPYCYKTYYSPPREAPCENCPVLKTLEDGKVHEVLREFEVDDDVRYHRIVACPVKNDAGEITSAVEMVEDITSRRRMEQELERTNKSLQETLEELRSTQGQLISQERQRALTQMASGIAHDFNNALSTVSGFTNLLLEDPSRMDNKETMQHYLQMINNAAQEAGEVVRRMRKFYRPSETETRQVVNVNELINEAISMTEPRWHGEARAENINIEINTEFDEVPYVEANEPEIHEMFTNLIFNAVEAMPHGGTLSFKTSLEDGYIRIEVADEGTGMSETTRRLCMEPFYTTRRTQHGTGLGLSTVQGIVKRHSGTIQVQSEEDKGTTFVIHLPATSSREEEQSYGAGTQAAEEVPSSRILLVEDDERQREVLCEMLRDKHTIEAVGNGTEGLQKLQDGHYDIVITDRALPDLNGDTLALTANKLGNHKYVVMLTGFGDMMEAVNECPEHVDLLVSKPVTGEKLFSKLASLFTQKEATDEK